MTTWAALLDYVMPHVAKVESAMAEHMLRLAAIEFCRTSAVDRAWLTAFNTVADTPSYVLTLPADKALAEVLRVRLDDTYELDPLRDDETPTDETVSDTPTHFLGSGEKTLLLSPPPDAVFSVDCRVALEPAIGAPGLETWIAQRHGEAIGHGAIGRLLAMPRKPWTDAQGALYYKGLAAAAALDARAEADQGKTGAPTRTRPVFGLR